VQPVLVTPAPLFSPDFSQTERGLFAIRFRRNGQVRTAHRCGGSFGAALERLAQG